MKRTGLPSCKTRRTITTQNVPFNIVLFLHMVPAWLDWTLLSVFWFLKVKRCLAPFFGLTSANWGDTERWRESTAVSEVFLFWFFQQSSVFWNKSLCCNKNIISYISSIVHLVPQWWPATQNQLPGTKSKAIRVELSRVKLQWKDLFSFYLLAISVVYTLLISDIWTWTEGKKETDVDVWMFWEVEATASISFTFACGCLCCVLAG